MSSATFTVFFTPDSRLGRLQERRRVLITYLAEVTREEDWHGVMDAAADLREVDAELRGLERG